MKCRLIVSKVILQNFGCRFPTVLESNFRILESNDLYSHDEMCGGSGGGSSLKEPSEDPGSEKSLLDFVHIPGADEQWDGNDKP